MTSCSTAKTSGASLVACFCAEMHSFFASGARRVKFLEGSLRVPLPAPGLRMTSTRRLLLKRRAVLQVLNRDVDVVWYAARRHPLAGDGPS